MQNQSKVSEKSCQMKALPFIYNLKFGYNIGNLHTFTLVVVSSYSNKRFTRYNWFSEWISLQKMQRQPEVTERSWQMQIFPYPVQTQILWQDSASRGRWIQLISSSDWRVMADLVKICQADRPYDRSIQPIKLKIEPTLPSEDMVGYLDRPTDQSAPSLIQVAKILSGLSRVDMVRTYDVFRAIFRDFLI